MVVRMDESTALFRARQLEKIKAQVYEYHRPLLKARDHIPMTPEPAGAGAESITAEYYDAAGQAKVVSSYANDWPDVEIRAQEHTIKIKSLGDSYKFSFQEIRAAQFARRDLTSRKALAAKRAVMELENSIAYLGSPEDGLMGLFNHPNVPVKTLNYKLGPTSTPQQIINTVNDLVNTPITFTGGVETVNTLLVSVEAYTHMASTPRSETTDTTILEFLQNAHRDKGLQIDWCTECKGNGYGGADIAFAYYRDPAYLTLEVASDFEQLPPFDNGSITRIKCHERFAGVFIYYPLAFVKGEEPLA